MGLKDYGVLKCHAIAGIMELDDDSPHYQVHVNDGNFDYRIAINVRSVQKPYDLLYLIDNNFEHYITQKLKTLNFGFNKIEVSQRQAGGIALDYIRGNLFKVNEMKALPYSVPGENNDLNEFIDLYIQRAIATKAEIYAFGEPWGPEEKADKIFDFKPGRGIHDIHMNQGSSGKFQKDNGVYQDGGLLIHYKSAPQDYWVAAFFAFQSQSFHTDDNTGNPIDKNVGNEPKIPDTPAVKPQVRIIAALLNPSGEDVGKESITLINSSPNKVDLTGWAIVNQLKQKASLDGFNIEPGAVVKVPLSGKDVQLSNKGGTLSLLNQEGIKVDGVSYTKKDTQEEGWTTLF
ncbi:DUF2278 family protein [Mastigocladus laminosus UU774]|nr:hypothetical protein B4U84_17290 [Westiellopsis prolifica IICB1]TFI54461.1 DUF2278 family protein [Mastigocladus laminosus UU774]